MNFFGKNISLIIYDFDGVMTDNRALIFENGDEAVFINRSDGLAIQKIKELNVDQIIISSEKKSIVKKRAEKLGIIAFNSVEDKVEELIKYVNEKNIKINECAFLGNDLNDLPLMEKVALKIAPIDAAKEILEIADYVINVKGGHGVIRELYSKLIMEKK